MQKETAQKLALTLGLWTVLFLYDMTVSDGPFSSSTAERHKPRDGVVIPSTSQERAQNIEVHWPAHPHRHWQYSPCSEPNLAFLTEVL